MHWIDNDLFCVEWEVKPESDIIQCSSAQSALWHGTVWQCNAHQHVDAVASFVSSQRRTVTENWWERTTVKNPGLSASYISRESKTTRNVLWSRAPVCLSVSVCVCLCVCLSAAACLQYCTDLDVTWGSGRGCPLVVRYWADLQSVHGMRCYGNIMEMRGRAQR